jgi:hypothetical protein
MNAELEYLTEVLGVRAVLGTGPKSSELSFVTPQLNSEGQELLQKMAQALGSRAFQILSEAPASQSGRILIFDGSNREPSEHVFYAPLISELLGPSPDVLARKRELWGRLKVWFSH